MFTRYKTLVFLVVVSTLSGCTFHKGSREAGARKHYIQGGQTVQSISVPPGLSASDLQNTYPIPDTNTAQATAPNAIPPGSHPERFATQNVVHSSKTSKVGNASLVPAVAKMTLSAPPISTVSAMQSPGSNALTPAGQTNALQLQLHMSEQKAWESVGKALLAAHVQVLDQDDTMGSYFILDPTATNNRITATTPIYRINLLAQGSDMTQVVVLDQKDQKADSLVTARVLNTLRRSLGI